MRSYISRGDTKTQDIRELPYRLAAYVTREIPREKNSSVRIALQRAFNWCRFSTNWPWVIWVGRRVVYTESKIQILENHPTG